jgi:serine/threonine-protein kinase
MDGLEATLGRLHPDTVSEGTITALMPRPAVRPAGDAATAGSAAHGSSALPTHFSADDLAGVVARLGRHIGPMAQVLVRRVARGCPDLATLHARLAEQLTDPAARLAFQQDLRSLATGTGRGGTAPGAGGSRATVVPSGAPAAATSAQAHAQVPASPALADAAQRLLAREVGPIAALLVKKALAATPQRAAFLQRLAGAVDDPAARARLLDALGRLPD